MAASRQRASRSADGSGSGTDTSNSDLTNLENQLSTLTASDTAFQSTQASEMAALQASQASQMATITQQSQSKETQIQALEKQIAALKTAATTTGKKQTTTTTQAGQFTAAQAAATQTNAPVKANPKLGQAGVEPSLSTHAASKTVTTHPGGGFELAGLEDGTGHGGSMDPRYPDGVSCNIPG